VPTLHLVFAIPNPSVELYGDHPSRTFPLGALNTRGLAN